MRYLIENLYLQNKELGREHLHLQLSNKKDSLIKNETRNRYKNPPNKDMQIINNS